MEIMINDIFKITNVFRINEIISAETNKKISIIIEYSIEIFESLQEFFINNNDYINNLKIYRNNQLIANYNNYVHLQFLYHNFGLMNDTIELILEELSIKEDEN